MIDLSTLSISKVRKAFDAKEYTPTDLVLAYLDVIEKKDRQIGAFREVFRQEALAEAKKADEAFANGTAKKLTGIPIAVKDNILISGHIAGASSKMLENFVAPYDATAIARLRSEGAIFIGRTNMDEFAMGSSTENSAYGPSKNPVDETRVPGGSSGGSAAAVAMHGALVGLGTDTGGSVRQPASFCGVIGFKPTYGAVSRNGLIAMGSSLDQLGTISRSVEDTKILFDIVKGTDPMDGTSFYPSKQKEVSTKLSVGVPRNLFEGLNPEILKNLEQSIIRFKELGYEVTDLSLPNLQYALAAYYVIMPAEVSSNLARYDGVKYGHHIEGKDLLEDYLKTRRTGFGKEVRRRIMLGTYVLSSGYYDAFYGKALNAKSLIAKDYQKAFESVDLILTPTTPTPAFKFGEKIADPLAMYLADVFTVPANIAGNPAISIPSGTVSEEGKELPLGIQLVAQNYQENILFHAGKEFLGEEV